MKKIFSLLLLSVILFSCKKNDTAGPVVTPVSKLKKQLGTTIGNEVTASIGAAGGTVQSADGIMRLTIPAGAVNAETNFSIQKVTNSLGTKGFAYRLKPEGVDFQKPVTLTYYYGGIDLGSIDPKSLFLTCQDKEGYYYSAKYTKGNRANHTLTVETTHFSDWTFYSEYELYVEPQRLTNGKVRLTQGESFNLVLKNLSTEIVNGPLDPMLTLIEEPMIRAAAWDYLAKKGTLNVTQGIGHATYTAPAQIPAASEIVITAMLTGNLGKDNEGNPVGMMQFVQPVVLESDDYFILSEDGLDMAAGNFSADLVFGSSIQIGAIFANGYNLSVYDFAGTTGSHPYQMVGTPGTAAIDMVDADLKGWRSFRPEVCNQSSNLIFSPGSLVMTKVANSIGEYTEGHFTVTLWKFSYCQTGGTKTLSGRFRIKKTV